MHFEPFLQFSSLATILEERLPIELGIPAEVVTQLESLEDHAAVHHVEHYTGRPE